MAAEQYGGTVYRFGCCEFRPDTQTLRVDGKPVVLEATPFRVLATLIERAGEIVSRGAMIDAIWGDKVVEENNLSVQVSAVRKALGPERDAIRTFPGMGYRFSGDLEGAQRTAPAAVPATIVDRRQGNMPGSLPELFGRADETRRVIDRLKAHRLVTIWGAGGMGKTSLALAVADRVRDDYPDGVWLVELASLPPAKVKLWKLPRQVREVCAVVAQALDLKLRKAREPLEELKNALAARRLLLVLDNCEHLHEAAALLSQVLLDTRHGAPNVRLLATSQVLIGKPGQGDEWLDSLSLPAPGDRAPERHAAIQLLVARVRDVQPAFVLAKAEDIHHASELCRRLDGMPLAIELAASRVPFFGLAELCKRLNEGIEAIAGRHPGAPTRQKTLKATIAWSHDLLSDGAQAVFRRCGVFQGSFALDEAEKVLAASGEDPWQAIEHLVILVERSLVVVERGEPPRYRMLESTRDYAENLLKACSESEATSARHAQAFCERFEASLADEWQLRSQDRIARYMPDLDNGRAALKWSARHDAALYIRLAGAIAWLLDAAGQSIEARTHCREALKLVRDPGTPHVEQARLGEAIALVDHSGFGRDALAGAWLAVRNRRKIPDPRVPDARDANGRRIPEPQGLYLAAGRLAIAASLFGKPWCGRRAVNHMKRIEQQWAPLSHWDLMQADDYVSNQAGEEARAEDIARRELAWATRVDDKHKTMFAMMALQQCAAARGEREVARELAMHLVETAEKHRYVKGRHIYIYNLAVELALGDSLESALPWARVASDEDRRHGSLGQELDLLAKLATLRGRWAAAAVIAGRSHEELRRRRQKREPVENILYEQVLEQLRHRPERSELDALRIKGVSLDLEEAVELALDDDADAHAALMAEVERRLEQEAQNRAFTRKAVRAWKKAQQQAVVDETT